DARPWSVTPLARSTTSAGRSSKPRPTTHCASCRLREAIGSVSLRRGGAGEKLARRPWAERRPHGRRPRPGGGGRKGGYRSGENAAGSSSLFSCLIGRTPDCGGHWPPLRDSSRIRVRSLESL